MSLQWFLPWACVLVCHGIIAWLARQSKGSRFFCWFVLTCTHYRLWSNIIKYLCLTYFRVPVLVNVGFWKVLHLGFWMIPGIFWCPKQETTVVVAKHTWSILESRRTWLIPRGCHQVRAHLSPKFWRTSALTLILLPRSKKIIYSERVPRLEVLVIGIALAYWDILSHTEPISFLFLFSCSY